MSLFLQSADNIEDVCEYRGTQLDPDSEQNNAREHPSTDETESDCLQATTSNARASPSVKHELMQLTNTSDQQPSNKKDEHINESLSSDKDWTMKEVEKFYNKVNENENKPHSDRDNKSTDERIPNQEHITKMLGLKRSYQFGLAVFAISMAVTVLSTNRCQYLFSQK